MRSSSIQLPGASSRLKDALAQPLGHFLIQGGAWGECGGGGHESS